ncbi:hypothetical protein K1719_024753 [Acacia pycnantha]|nr:hypothetical protein K1719_024753 [Acacia pycnantha]
MAAASIGQLVQWHATSSSPLDTSAYYGLTGINLGASNRAVTKDGMHAAMKIHYPGVSDSIEGDIENVKFLLDYTNLIPEGLYLHRAMIYFPSFLLLLLYFFFGHFYSFISSLPFLISVLKSWILLVISLFDCCLQP